MELDLTTTLLIAAVAFLGAFVYGLTGFGAGLVQVPLATLFVDLRFALAVYALLDTVIAIRVTLQRHREVVREEALRLIPSCMVGVAIGAALLAVLPTWILMLSLGVFVLAYVSYRLAVRGNMPGIGRGWSYPFGVAGGMSSAMFGAGGPLYAIYLSMRPHDTHATRSTLAATTLVSISTRVIAFAVTGMLSSPKVWVTALVAVPAALVGLKAADRAHGALSREGLLQAITVMLFVAGVSLVLRALRSA